MAERVKSAKRHTRPAVLALCLGLFGLIAITGCPAPPDPPCFPALACATVERYSNAGGCSAFEDRLFWKGGTRHKTVGIWVTYRIDAVALNPPPPSPPVQYTSRQIEPYKEVDLGCQYVETTAGTGNYFRYTYTPVSACFLNDPKCTQPVPVASSTAPATCLKQCTGPDCVEYRFNSVQGDLQEGQARVEVAKAIHEVLSTATLSNVSLTGVLGLKGFCPNRSFLNFHGNDFLETGSTCSAFLQVRSSPVLRLRLSLPPQLSGKFARALNQSASFDFPDPTYSPVLEWFDENGSIGFENVAHIEVSPGLVKIVGTRHFCIWIYAGEAKN